eukprot:TRINITY_DN3324_c0_g1_i1.p1 TRINITY_DN3324_c0_g1~~TRINITY_DN3324_c0_g1_i1.p1  ORF type:complete len:608 (-),score=185.75 TRINITY_DN3324_c0_g1_i1:312-2135(-)
MTSSPSKLPLLPGYDIQIGRKKNFHKTHIFDIKNHLRTDRMQDTLEKPEFRSMKSAMDSSVSMPQSSIDYSSSSSSTFSSLSSTSSLSSSSSVSTSSTASISTSSSYTSSSSASSTSSSSSTLSSLELTQSESKMPAWLAYDRKVLRYYAYFKESVHSSSLENYRVRRCVIYYYLEDGSMHIAEPRQENSGIPQGVFVKRHRILKPSKLYFSVDDFSIGAELPVYGRVFRIVDADPFTRWFHEQNGMDLGKAEEYPVDPFVKKQATKASTFHKLMHPFKLFLEASKGKPIFEIEACQKFLQNDGKVLRFYCTWDDKDLFGEKRPYVLHYYLADDTVEIVEIQQANSGRDPFPALLKRQRLPRDPSKLGPDLSCIGVKDKDVKLQYYTLTDFKCDQGIHVFGRSVMICGCDKFTQNYYVKNYGADPQDYHLMQVEDELEEVPKIQPPPHNGIGTEEDSLGSFLYLVPKVPKQDFKKLMELDGINLRYLAKLAKCPSEEKDRRFIITYYLNNDTVSIFEKFERNSGFVGGKFLERARVKNPDTGEYYKSTDLWVGAQVMLNKYLFEVIEGDEYTLAYMNKAHPNSKWAPKKLSTSSSSSSSKTSSVKQS